MIGQNQTQQQTQKQTQKQIQNPHKKSGPQMRSAF